MSGFPPEELECPDPAGCPIVDPASRWSAAVVELSGSTWYRAYNGAWGYDEFNPGFGDARFSPFDDADRERVPSLYVAGTEVAALLESLFRTADSSAIGITGPAMPTLPEARLREWLLVAMTAARPARLADFRDPALDDLGVRREGLTSSPAEHYPCTRRVAKAVHADRRRVEGIVWHSRQAEFTGLGPVEAVVLFGDRFPSERGLWHRREAGSRNLHEGPGRELAQRVAVQVGVRIV
jgi:hypothetical protein